MNEGFATWAGWLGVDHLFPEWHIWEQFLANGCADALGTDAKRSSHPVEVPIHDSNMIDQVFDALSYRKGACIIRIVEAYIGTDALRAGVFCACLCAPVW